MVWIIQNMQMHWRLLFMKTNFIKLLCSFYLMTLAGCSVFSIERTPYSVTAEFVMEEDSPSYKICGVDFSIYNFSTESIKEFELVFFLFDSDGEPASECPGRLSFTIEKEIEPDEVFNICLNLDSYITSVPQSLLEIDYLYVSKIVYANGSVWEDPFGFSAFM